MKLYKNSFLNLKNNKVRYSESIDRKQCAIQFNEYLDKLKQNSKDVKINAKRLNVYELVKDAIKLRTNQCESSSATVTNLQWEENKKNNKTSLGNIIAMVDTSGSMESSHCIPLYSAIGLGIRVSECANEGFRDRVLTFSANPTWFDLSKQKTFTDKVHHLRNAHWGTNTNFYLALKMILDVIIQNNMEPSTVEDMVLAVFSDMQIDVASHENMNTMYEQITQMYAAAGMESKWAQPYKPPHILFWNLSHTTGFPSLSSQQNTTMLSGYSSVLLNEFADKGMTALKEFTPFKMISEILNKPRYQILHEQLFDTLFDE
jgi:Mg-chelatase subunit ChlD